MPANAVIAFGIFGTWLISEFVFENKSEFKSFREGFECLFQITNSTFRFCIYNNFAPNGKFTQNFIKIGDIGKGSYGEVYKVKQKISGDIFAIKTIATENEKGSLGELSFSLHLLEIKSEYTVKHYDRWYENDPVEGKILKEYTEKSRMYI
jgi:serine/threonine protein kinase